MARGWESKSVESQQSDDEPSGKAAQDAEDLQRRSKRESLEMSRRRIARELESATSAVHRTALENALKFLDDELTKL